MLGAYHIREAGTAVAAMSDPRLRRLKAAWPNWKAGVHPSGGCIVAPAGLPGGSLDVATYDQATESCTDGLIWLPPSEPPTLYDLARDDPPREITVVRLRRVGPVNVPIGLGPMFGLGPKRGQPSSEFGTLAHDLRRRAKDPEHVWDTADELAVERLLFLGLQLSYSLTWEIWCRIAPYDLDEVGVIIDAIWGLDPKALPGVAPTSVPSPPGPSPTPN